MGEERLRRIGGDDVLLAGPVGGVAAGVWANARFRFPLKAAAGVLGVDIGRYLSEARLRQGILSRGARSSWGVECGVLRMTHDAMITSLPRNALRVVGTMILERLVL